MIKRIVLIDGANLYATVRGLGKEMDFSKLHAFFNADGNLLRINYYTAIDESEDVVTIRPLVDWLSYNGYTVVSKPARIQTTHEGNRRVKGNMDIEMAVDAMLMAASVTDVVLVTGDGDFGALINALKMKGVRVTVCSSNVTKPQQCAPSLRRLADAFIELDTLMVYTDGSMARKTAGR